MTRSLANSMIACLAAAAIVPRVESLQTAQAATAMANYSKDAIGLFNNMRTPAALLTGGLVPLGILMNSPIHDDDSRKTRVLKKAGVVLGVTSLLSEILAVVYSSIAINKLVELPSPDTASVADLLSKHHSLPWLGTNVHFILGMMGFVLLVGIRTYLAVGASMGTLAAGLSAGCFLQTLAVVNRSIALGRSGGDHVDAANLGQLLLHYGRSMFRFATRGKIGVCSVLSMVVTAAAVAGAIASFYEEFRDGASG